MEGGSDNSYCEERKGGRSEGLQRSDLNVDVVQNLI